jgi:hypothetical protein
VTNILREGMIKSPSDLLLLKKIFFFQKGQNHCCQMWPVEPHTVFNDNIQVNFPQNWT